MNVFIQFVNRFRELEFLERATEKSSALIVVYGRRRVGKSELLKQFLKGRKALYLLATQEVEKEILESFSRDVADFFGDSALKVNPFFKFNQLIEYFREKDLSDLILVFDEFPYLVDSNKAIPSIIQKYWDSYFKEKGLKLVLCGSSIGAMETEVMGRKSPLYGRRTGQWKVEPLSFKDFVKFFPKKSFEQLIELYSVSGGIPLYILEMASEKNSFENAKDSIATRGAMLYQEVELLLKEELREPKTYFSLLKEIARGKCNLNELSNALGMERTALIRYLDTLMELDLIAAINPVTSKEKSRNTQYILKDNYFKFWFEFVYPFKKDLDSFVFESFKKNFGQNFNAFVGRQFEQICREILEFQFKERFEKFGNWWGNYRENNERKACEIDIVALNESKKEILFAECKWQNQRIKLNQLIKLEEKSKFVQWNQDNRKEFFAFFSKKKFDEKSKKYVANKSNWKLYDLKDLKRIINVK